MALPPPLPPTPTVQLLDRRLLGPGALARIDVDEVARLRAETGLDSDALLLACLPWAQRWASAPISHYRVGAAALAGSGAIYLGANLELAGLELAQTVHAEQAVIAQAKAHGEGRIVRLGISAAPCGFCRQFMLELEEPPALILADRWADRGADRGPVSLAELLPWAFGPAELGRAPQLLRAGPRGLRLRDVDLDPEADPALALALAAADRSSAPYSGGLAGVALSLADGSRFAGGVAESVAYNPTLGPMQAALVAAHLGGARLAELTDAVLVERAAAAVSQRRAAAAVLAAVAPRVSLRHAFAI